MIRLDPSLSPSDLTPHTQKLWQLLGKKVFLIDREYDVSKGSPVFTVNGKYTTRGWTEWTQGFQYGLALLHFDATDETASLEYGRKKTVELMAPHVSHVGVHDHGFNNISTYGNLRRLMREGRISQNDWEMDFYELALKVSGAVQARRWTPKAGGGGYMYSFNGPHSLFVDTVRSCRILFLSHQLGHVLMEEGDVAVSLAERALQHMKSTADYSIYYGEGRDKYDIWGRTAHESIFDTNNGVYRCPNAQQGFSGFTTWTRGLAWAILGFAEELELLPHLADDILEPFGGRDKVEAWMMKAAKATSDFFIEHTPVDGIPYWDTGAPRLHMIKDALEKPADPYNDFEPVDSTAAAIACQGLIRLGKLLVDKDQEGDGSRYFSAGLTSLKTLLQEPYLSFDDNHQGLLLHSIYHEPNGWDNVPEGQKIASGESSMWGDYHLAEAALYVDRLASGKEYYTYFK